MTNQHQIANKNHRRKSKRHCGVTALVHKFKKNILLILFFLIGAVLIYYMYAECDKQSHNSGFTIGNQTVSLPAAQKYILTSDSDSPLSTMSEVLNKAIGGL